MTMKDKLYVLNIEYEGLESFVAYTSLEAAQKMKESLKPAGEYYDIQEIRVVDANDIDDEIEFRRLLGY